MLFLSIILNRTKRVIICLKRVIVKALAATALLTGTLISAMSVFSGTDTTFIVLQICTKFF